MQRIKQTETSIFRMSKTVKQTLKDLGQYYGLSDSALLRTLLIERKNELLKLNVQIE